MRKIFLTLALLLSLAVATPAGAFGFDWGITGGLNLTKLRLGDGLSNLKSDNQAGWFIGPKVNLSLVAGLGLDASLQYSQRKLQVYSEQDDQSSYKTFRSIEIPINLKYSFGVGKVASVYVATGPQFGFNVGSRSWRLFDGDGEGMFRNENMTTTWNLGAGVKVLGHLDIGVGYNFGLGKVGETFLSNISDNLVGSNDDYKANTFQVQATYYF